MAANPVITAEHLRSRLDYNPETGLFTWKAKLCDDVQSRRWNGKYVGKVAGSVGVNGYVEIGFNKGGVRFRGFAHRLAWLHVHGVLPSKMIDHIDGNKTNNRISNLREATFAENSWNTGARSWSKSGVKGVSWDKSRGKWFASIFVHRKQIALGRYDSIQEAAAAYAEAARLYHGEFANLG